MGNQMDDLKSLFFLKLGRKPNWNIHEIEDEFESVERKLKQIYAKHKRQDERDEEQAIWNDIEREFGLPPGEFGAHNRQNRRY